MSGKSCSILREIQVQDDPLGVHKRKALLQPFIGVCISAERIQKILSVLSEAYFKQGWITTRPYLSEQNIHDGILKIKVLQGRIDSIISRNTRHSNLRLRNAFWGQRGHRLDLNRLETSLERMNRASYRKNSFEILPGDSPGRSVIEVDDTDGFPYSLTLGTRIRSGSERDQRNLTVSLNVYHPAEINDLLTYSQNQDESSTRQQTTRSREFEYSLPLGPMLTWISYSRYRYKQGVNGINQTFFATGETRAIRGRGQFILYRRHHHILSGQMALYFKDSLNYFAERLLEVSSYKTTVVEPSLQYQRHVSRHDMTISLGVQQGVDWFGARPDRLRRDLPGSSQARLQFRKWFMEWRDARTLSKNGYRWEGLLRIQVTPHRLFDDNKLTIGSDYTVRGYSEQNYFGNNGGYLRNDLTRTWYPGHDSLLLDTVTGRLGVDYGDVRCEADNLGSCGGLFGLSAGVETGSVHLQTRLQVGYPLTRLSPTFSRMPQWHVGLSWTF